MRLFLWQEFLSAGVPRRNYKELQEALSEVLHPKEVGAKSVTLADFENAALEPSKIESSELFHEAR